MDVNQEYFLKLISSQLNDTEVEVYEGAVDWDEIYRLSKIHNLIVIVFSAINKLDDKYKPPYEIYNKMKNEFLFCVHFNMEITIYTDRIINEFEQNEIEHLIIKGYVLRDYYISPEYRSMSDVDMLIREKDRQKTHEIMLKLGYENTIRGNSVWNYKKKNSFVEIHTGLIEKEIKEDANFVGYFSNAWSHLEPYRGKNSYTLEKNYQLIYLIVHMAKHFFSCGCGVRMIMDIAVFIDKFSDELDMNFIFAELERLKLDLFTKNILILCNKWFHMKLYFEYELDQDFYEELSQSILLGGTFGFERSNFRIAQIRNEITEEGYIKSLLSTIRKVVFLPYNELIKHRRYAFLEGRKYLLPVAWIYRGFYQLKSRSLLGAVKYITSILFSKNKVQKDIKTIKKLGI